MLQRSLTIAIGLPFVICAIIFANAYVFDAIIALIAIIGISEYMHCVKTKFKAVSWIGYISAASLVLLHVVKITYILKFLPLIILGLLALLFMHVVFTDMKINAVDIAVSFFGIVYVVGFFAFVALLYGYELKGEQVGKFYLSYLLLATWGSDVFAYLIGKFFGKHRFSQISPKKTIEGCIAGTIAGVSLMLIATVIYNQVFDLGINYLIIGIIALVINLLGQIGDFSASCIKRYADVKDFSNLLPGHGGILDRFDSVIFAAPFAYYLLTLFL